MALTSAHLQQCAEDGVPQRAGDAEPDVVLVVVVVFQVVLPQAAHEGGRGEVAVVKRVVRQVVQHVPAEGHAR